ncbi:MAG: sugar ABC transporter permease [Chloroflexota bacterium]
MAASASIQARPARRSSLLRNEVLAGYLFASPFIVGFLVFFAFPMVYSLYLSFNKWDLLTPPRFVGFAQFTKMFGDSIANLSLYNSAFYTILAVPVQLVISFSLAMLLTQAIKGRDFYRAAFYLPIIVPLVAWSVVWQRMFHVEFGIFNIALNWVGIESQEWLFDADLAKPAMVIMSFWYIGRQMVIFIAGLGSIPDSMLEAASIDGAGPLRRLRHIVLPLMTPFIFYNMVIAIINSFQSFIPAIIMTNGGPQNATLFAVLNIYRNGFEFFKMGYASALAWEFFVIVVMFTIAQFFISQRWVHYES